ncbi:MAG TPA: NUDIX domain-containing protein [Candidatus Bathyarchaeia archaeon]|nr:NUDIX domain-containing protein [Candidatus Bathyarchaeia archaeon]
MVDSEGRFVFTIAAIMENPSGEILLLKRSAYKSPVNIWDIVGGGVNQFEDPFDALSREIMEETSIKSYDLIKAIDVFSDKHEDNDIPEMIGITFWCKTITKEIYLSDEHTAFKWLKPKEALAISEHPVVKRNIERFIHEKKRLGLEVE